MQQELEDTKKQLNDKTAAESKAQQDISKLTKEKVLLVVNIIRYSN